MKLLQDDCSALHASQLSFYYCNNYCEPKWSCLSVHKWRVKTLNKEEMDKLITTENATRNAYITKIEHVLLDLLSEYFKIHDDLESEDYKNLSIIQALLQEPKWYISHDNVWQIFLELKHNLSIKYIINHVDEHKSFYKIDLSQIQRNLDPDMHRNIKDIYASKYLDSEPIVYDGDILICDPFILMDKTSQNNCLSMFVHDTLTEPQTYFAATDDYGKTFGSVKITTGHICTVLMSDLWNISVNDILHRLNVWDYIYVKQFHGTVQYIITKNDTYRLRIIGDGNKPFTLEQLKK